MISGLILGAKSWRCVGPWRCAAAAVVLLAADALSGLAVAALLGMWVGRGQQ